MATVEMELSEQGRPFQWELVRVETATGIYVGRLYIPRNKRRLSDVLDDRRPFLNLRDVTTGNGEAPEPFVALGKSHVLCVRLLNASEQEQYVRDRGYIPGSRRRP
jgi:hypothetical protein